MKIWKYTLEEPVNNFRMPQGARVLSAAARNSDVCIWVLADPDQELVERRILAAPTGARLPTDVCTAIFIGTVMHPSGLVWHIFDGGEK